MKKQAIYQMSLYLVVGIMTTLVNIVAYYVCTRFLGGTVMVATVAAWLFAVLFAFVGNKWIVFRSRRLDAGVVMREFFSFVSCRLITGIIDIVAMGFFVEMLGFPDIVMKVIANGLIIVGNFLASKYIIFKTHMNIMYDNHNHVRN